MTAKEKSLIIAAVTSVAFLAVGTASMDVHPVKTVKVPVKVQNTKTIYKTRTRTVVKNVPPKKPSGYIPQDNCYKIANGTKYSDLLFRYGWPAEDNAEDSYAGLLMYPLAEDHSRYCVVSFTRGEIDSVRIDIR